MTASHAISGNSAKMRLSLAILLLFAWICASSAQPDLFEAVRNDDAEAIVAALDQGADINAAEPTSLQTPLMHGVLHGKEVAVATLLQKLADVTIPEKDGYTPMHGAGFQGRAQIARLLIQHGLDPSNMHPDGYTPLHRACWGREQRHTDTVRVFLDAGVPFDQPSRSGKRPIDMASKNHGTVRLLRERAEVVHEL